MIAIRKSATNSLLRQNVREQGIGGAIELWKRNNVVARFGDVHERIVNRGHPGANAQGLHPALEGCDALFKYGVSGIPNPSIDISLDFEIEEGRSMLRAIKFEGDGLVDRHRDGLRGRVAFVTCVNRDGFSFHAFAGFNLRTLGLAAPLAVFNGKENPPSLALRNEQVRCKRT